MKIIIGHKHAPKVYDEINAVSVGNFKRKLDYSVIMNNHQVSAYKYPEDNHIISVIKANIKIVIVGDGHLEAGITADCIHDDDPLFEFFTFLLSIVDGNKNKIVLVGDIYDLSQSVFPYCQKKKLKKIKEHFPKTCAIIDSLPNKIYGNHDYKMKKYEGWKETISLLLNGEVFEFMHGHQFSKAYERWPRLNTILLWFVGWGERLFGKDIDEKWQG